MQWALKHSLPAAHNGAFDTGHRRFSERMRCLAVLAIDLALCGCAGMTTPQSDGFSWRYGNFCGQDHPPTSGTQQEQLAQLRAIEPWDDIDRACQAHDICYVENRVSMVPFWEFAWRREKIGYCDGLLEERMAALSFEESAPPQCKAIQLEIRTHAKVNADWGRRSYQADAAKLAVNLALASLGGRKWRSQQRNPPDTGGTEMTPEARALHLQSMQLWFERGPFAKHDPAVRCNDAERKPP